MRGAAPALLRVALLASLAGAGGGAARAFTPGVDGPVSSVRALEGARAELACDTAPPESAAHAHDRLMLLVWYKDDEPVYSYDARVPSEWSSSAFNASGRVRAARGGAALSVARAAAADAALYHCRVDFQLSPTRNSAVNLTVVVLPSLPFFLDEFGNKVEGRVGPYHEGDNLLLSCLVIGGNPPPQVRWYSGDSLLDATDGASEIPGVRENELYLPLARSHAAAPLACRAANTDLAPPRVAALQLELYVTAESVELWWESGAEADGALVAGRRAVARCRAVGAHPQPALSWWLDHHELPASANQTWDPESRTAETRAALVPTRAQHGAALSCVATNVLLAPTRATTANTSTLTVLYSPAVEVAWEGEGRPGEVAEGEPLRLRCEVEANPPVETMSWYFNDTEVTVASPLPGAAVSERGAVLALAAARRYHAGRYACGARNARGAARSEELNLAVLYAPECRGAGVSLAGESLSCDVDALPPPDTFLWRVRGAGELQKVTTGAPVLRLSLLQGSLDGGLQAWCEATNVAGSQRAACEATVQLDRLRPALPARCDIAYEMDAFRVHCEPGGNATYYMLSVWRQSASNLSTLAWRARSAYGTGGSGAVGAVGALSPGDTAGVAACNLYGCSADTLLRPSAELLRVAYPPWWQGIFEKDFGISIGIVLIVAVLVVSSLVVTRLVGRSSRAKPPVIQLLQLDDFTARDYLDTLERKARSHKSCSSVYSGGSLDTECPPLVDRARKPLADMDERSRRLLVWPCEPAELDGRGSRAERVSESVREEPRGQLWRESLGEPERRKPLAWCEPCECPPDITANLTRESAV